MRDTLLEACSTASLASMGSLIVGVCLGVVVGVCITILMGK